MTNADEIRRQLEQLNNKELIDILLKQGEEQWQPAAVEIAGAILSERGAAAGKKPDPASGSKSTLNETAGLRLITVAEYVSGLDAEFDRLILEREGVRAWIFQDENPPAEGVPPCVQLKVCAEDWDAAMERLGSENTRFPGLPDDLA